jgi:hypothetical protein
MLTYPGRHTRHILGDVQAKQPTSHITHVLLDRYNPLRQAVQLLILLGIHLAHDVLQATQV